MLCCTKVFVFDQFNMRKMFSIEQLCWHLKLKEKHYSHIIFISLQPPPPQQQKVLQESDAP